MKAYKRSLNGLELTKKPTDIPSVKIKSADDAAIYMREFWSGDIEIYESFFLLILNRAGNTEAYVKISQGGTAGTVVDVKIICKYAIDCLANSVIVAHNHPSGTPSPSHQDIEVTKKISSALNLLDVRLLDHIVITKDSHYSFADNGLI